MGWIRQLPNGRHQAVYRDLSGRQRSRTFERNEKTLARRWIADKEAGLRRGEWRDPAGARTLFADWAEAWQANRVVQASTISAERHLLDLLILPEFGRRPLGQITRQQIQSWVKRLGERNYTANTIRRPYQVLRTILLAAVEEDLILRSPCRKITLPTGRPARVPEVLDVDQAAAVLANLRGAGVHALVLTTLGTGLRWQEVAWLRRRDVDLLRRQLRVREVLKTATKASGGMYGGPPKSRAGARPVPLPAAVVQALAALLPTGGGPDDIVFPSSRG